MATLENGSDGSKAARDEAADDDDDGIAAPVSVEVRGEAVDWLPNLLHASEVRTSKTRMREPQTLNS